MENICRFDAILAQRQQHYALYCTVWHRTALYCTALHHLAPHQVSSAQLSQLPERVRKAKENTFLFHFKRPGACLKKWQIKEFTFNLHYILVWFPLNPAFPGSRLLRIGACTNVLRMYNKSIANPFTSTLVSVSVFFSASTRGKREICKGWAVTQWRAGFAWQNRQDL